MILRGLPFAGLCVPVEWFTVSLCLCHCGAVPLQIAADQLGDAG
jgi:hypothetical protein